MSKDTVPQGLPFNLVYVAWPEPAQESSKARSRIALYVKELYGDRREKISQTLRQELGVDARPENLHKFLVDCSLAYFLASITHIYDGLPVREQYTSKSPRAEWLSFVRRVFFEESLTFEIDPLGGVHPAPDLEFVAVKVSTITLLTSPRYAAARTYLKEA